ncbi:MAG: response regulator [Leptospiraceae bacterium]|nr:response regulator [Leptospiraceae bacterium]
MMRPILFLPILWVCLACGSEYPQPVTPRAINGTLDLRDYDFHSSGPITLNGDWAFYPHVLLLPGDALPIDTRITADSLAWDSLEDPAHPGRNLPAFGFGTYRLEVLLPQTAPDSLALQLPAVATSYKLYANERLLFTGGKVAQTSTDAVPQMRPGVVEYANQTSQLVLLIQAANFTHSSGGIWTPPRLGPATQIQAEVRAARYLELFLCGALVIMGLYHLVLFAFRHQDRAPLYFGFLCLLVTLRVTVTGQAYLIQQYPDWPFVLFHKLEYLTFYVSVPVFMLFFHAVFPGEIHRWILRTILSVALLFTLAVLFLPVYLYSQTLQSYQFFTVLGGLYGTIVGLRAALRGRRDAWILLVGWTVLFVAVLHDILSANLVIQSAYWTPFAVFLFFFAQATMLALRFTGAFTRSERLARQLRSAERLYRGIFEDASEGVFLFDANGRILTANRSFARMLGADSPGALTGADLKLKFGDPDAWDRLRADLAHGPVWDFQTRILQSKDRTIEVTLNAHFAPDERNNRPRYQGMMLDISEKLRLEQLRIARDAAEASSRAKSQFLANMSHEIRTPMNAIIGMAELLAENPEPADRNRYMSILQGAGDTLIALIDDVLDLAKVESGNIQLEHIAFDLIELIESTTEMMAPQAFQKSLEVSLRIAPDVPQSVLGDPTRVRQILVNLISNAVKFTETGSILFEVTVNNEEVTFCVIDSGIGIPADKLESIFDAFTQADDSTTRRFGGTGLGLTISRRFAELMGGRLWADSQPMQGSRFYFACPFKTAPLPESAPMVAPIDLQGVRILVIDDMPFNRMMFQEVLTARGAQATTRSSGRSGLVELVRARMSDQPYDLVLLDFHMPDLDGLETARRIRADERLAGLAIVVLSSDNLPESRRRFEETGVDDYLTRPVRRADLNRSIALALNRIQRDEQGGSVHPGNQSVGLDHAPLRVLLVEDNVDNQILMKAYLKNAPVELHIAGNGLEALEMYEQHAFDLILMDMQMPLMDGYEATRRIRRAEAETGGPKHSGHVPIVALTAHTMSDEVEQTLAAGCDVHMPKPVKKKTLLQLIESYAGVNMDSSD